MRNADQIKTAFLWWTARWILIPGAILVLVIVLTVSRIETVKCMHSCTATGFGSYIYAQHRSRAATCECVNPGSKGAVHPQ